MKLFSKGGRSVYMLSIATALCGCWAIVLVLQSWRLLNPSNCQSDHTHKASGQTASAVSRASRLLPSNCWDVDAHVGRPFRWLPLPDYKEEARDEGMRAQKQVVDEYVASATFKEHVKSMSQLQPRGILINSGGSEYLTNLVVLLKVLRQDLNCSLPVEVVWHAADEMDNTTWAALQRHFAPLTGFDVSAKPYPKHHHRVDSLKRYEGKILALLFTSFREVLLLDSDSMPLTNPDFIFEDAQYRKYGNLFWPDAWSNRMNTNIYDTVGLSETQVQDILEAGKGFSSRETETGQLVIDRRRHADVLEYLFWINSYSNIVYKEVWGDKDTLPLAFAVAGKATLFSQVSIPPSGFFRWASQVLEVKDNPKQLLDGYQMMGFIQMDRHGRPFTIHRTLNKWTYPNTANFNISIITPPMPYWWLRYYLDHDNLGPTKGIEWQYNAPAAAFKQYTINPPPTAEKAVGRKWKKVDLNGGSTCPLLRFYELWSLLELGFPLDPQDVLRERCKGEIERMEASRYGQLCKESYLLYPQLKLSHQDYREKAVLDKEGAEVLNPSPLPALLFTDEVPLRAVHAAYRAYHWLLKNAKQFPIIVKG